MRPKLPCADRLKKSKRIAWFVVANVAGYTHGSKWLISAIIMCAKIARQNNGNDIDKQKILHEN